MSTKTIEQSFADWEAHAFGCGYGSGEPHIIPELHAFLTLCHREPSMQYDHRELETDLGGPVAWLLINALCQVDIIEYGTSPRGGWLTVTGQALRKFVLSRPVTELVEMACSLRDDPCAPDACNCGPRGYGEGRVCLNPFWNERAAVAYLGPRP